MTDAMYILDRSGDARRNRLMELESYFDGRQHDYLGVDWWGDRIEATMSYLGHRVGWSSKPVAKMEKRQYAAVARRPCVQVGLPSQIRQTFTNEIISSMPPVEVVADEEATECLTAMLAEADAAESFANLRSLGAVGSAALVVDIVDGEPSLTPRKSSDLHVVEWASMERAEPAVVDYQRNVTEYRSEKGKVEPVVMVHTTRYTPTEVIEYEPVELKRHKKGEPIPERDNGRREHYAGRCPVIWYQNTRSVDSPEGRHDLETEAVLEQSDRADQLFSSVFMASSSNAEPTVCRGDRLDASYLFGNKLAKGNGRLMQHSEDGKIYYLEISGASITAAWSTLDRVIQLIQKGAQCIVPGLEFGGLKTATEVERVWTSMDAKVRRMRSSLDRTMVQVCEVLLAMARALGVTSKEEPDREGSVVLPPKIVEDDDGDVVGAVPYNPGRGRTILVRWPASRQIQPKDLPGVLGALSLAAKGSQIMSQETAVGESMSSIGRTDVADELRRIEQEEHEREERGAAMFGADTANELAENADAASRLGDEEGAPGKPAGEVEEPTDKADDGREED